MPPKKGSKAKSKKKEEEETEVKEKGKREEKKGKKRGAEEEGEEEDEGKPVKKKAAKGKGEDKKAKWPTPFVFEHPRKVAKGEGIDEYVTADFDPKTQMKIISWNVSGLRALVKKVSLQDLADRETPDIICLQETKVDESLTKSLASVVPRGYTPVWSCCKTKKGYSGTACLVKEGVAVKSTTLGLPSPAEGHSKEGRLIALELDDFVLINTYVPNAGSKLERLDYRTKEWDRDMLKFLEGWREQGKHVVWAGDLNVAHKEIDLHNPKGNTQSAGFTQEERDAFSAILEAGYVDTFRHLHPDALHCYSYWGYRFFARDKNAGWRLDYFVVDKEFLPRVAQSHMLPAYYGSDHCPIVLHLSRSK